MGSVINQDIRNVALAGGTGLIGSLLAKSLIESGRFNVTILSRGGQNHLHPAAKVAIVDYTNTEQLSEALQGQDAIVSTLSRDATLFQIPLIDAAIIAGVKRFIPSEFGANLHNPHTRNLPNYKNKIVVQEYLEEKSKSHGITYTYIYNNMFFDWSIKAGILLDLDKGYVPLYNGGERAVSMISVSTAAEAVVGVLTHFDATKNRPVYIHEVFMSQKQILACAKQVWPDQDWHEDYIDLEALEAKADTEPTRGLPRMGIFHIYAVKGAFGEGFGNQYGEDDNDLLGIQALNANDVKDVLRGIKNKSE